MDLRTKIYNKNIDNLKQQLNSKNITQTGSEGWEYYSSAIKSITDNIEIDINSVYKKNSVVQACIKEIATSISEADLKVYKKFKNGKKVEISDKTYTNLFYNNKYFSYTDIMQLIVKRLELHGASLNLLESYIYNDGFGGFIPIPNKSINRIVSGLNVKYELKGSNEKIDINKIVEIMYPDPETLFGYTSPLESAIEEIKIDISRQMLTQEVFKNKKIPGLILETDQPIPQKQMEQLKDSVNKALGIDTRNRANSIVLPNGIKASKGHDVKDIDFSKLNTLTETRICAAFQVPPILVGLASGLEHATYSNYEQAVSSFYREKIKPLWKIIEEAFTRKILKGTDLVFEFDTKDIGELQEDKNTRAERVSKLYQGGIISNKEAREEMGYETELETEENTEEIQEEEKDLNSILMQSKESGIVKGYIVYDGESANYIDINDIDQLSINNINVPVFKQEDPQELIKKFGEE